MMKCNRSHSVIVLSLTGAIAVTVLSTETTEGGSFGLNEASVSGLGSAYAGGAANAEDSSILFYNPAGIALLDHGELQIGAQFVDPYAQFSNQGSSYKLPGTPFNGEPITGGSNRDAARYHVLPNVFLSQPIIRSSQYGDLTFGVGLTVPFGLETNYDDPSWVGRYIALRTKLLALDIQPTIAYRIWDRLSIGASLDVQYASARLTEAVDFGEIGANALGQYFPVLAAGLAARGVPPAAIPGIVQQTQAAYARAGFVPQGHDGISEVNGDDWATGFTIGAIFAYLKPNQNDFFQDGRIGVSYRSGINHNIRGSANFRGVPAIAAPGVVAPFPDPAVLQDTFNDQDASAGLDLPEIYHVSIYQRFLHQFAIMGDVEWTRWSRLQSVDINFSNPATPTVTLPIAYKDTERYAIGFEWYATKFLTWRLGFAYDETPIQSAETRTPRIPDNDRYFLSTGFQLNFTRSLSLDVGYAHLFVNDSTVNYTDSQGHNLSGKFEEAVDIVSAAISFKWGGPREEAPPQELPTKPSKDTAGYVK